MRSESPVGGWLGLGCLKGEEETGRRVVWDVAKGTRQADSVSGDIMLDHRKKRVKRAAKDRDTAHFRHMTLLTRRSTVREATQILLWRLC